MSKTIRVSDELYDEISEWSEAEMRSISNATEYLLKKGILFASSPISENTFVVQTKANDEDYHLVPPEKNTVLPKGNEGFVEAGVNKEKLNVLVPGCCKQVKPCKHWQWNGLEQVYINTITGERKEVQ